MPIARAQVIFHAATALPEDAIVNTFHFRTQSAGVTDDEAQAIAGALSAAYTRTDAAVGNSVAEFLSSAISRSTPPTIKTYGPMSAATGDFGSPIREDQFASNLAAPLGAGPLPREVALCLSYHGDLTNAQEEAPDDSDLDAAPERPASRRRGRIYIGPLSQAALTAGTDSRPGNAVIQAIARMGEYLLTAPALVAEGVEWCVLSQPNRPGEDPGPSTLYTVTGVWVDNEWDTQRRRGLRRTTRTTFGTGL